ncbi:hypothetical protein Q8A67_001967 [Cirrhinus molitorella]|uniref:Fibronectin type-III domain-containing protein n=1 Tax=Cirrhinus molitorella TaxID=172907 RepID=A0AA88TWD7_9TELE|nr:hypothetical protein Q8A67_001967 [Cirrhinus molitorella]
MDYTSKEEKNPNEAASEDTEDKQQTFPHSFESYQKEEVAKLQGVPAPGKILVRLTGTNYVTLAWNSPDNISTFELTCFSPTTTKTYTVINATATEVEDLCPGTEYRFSLVSVSANGDRSLRSEVTACTRPVPPDKFKAENVGPTSVTLIWDASGCEEKKFHIVCYQNKRIIQEETTQSGSVVFSDLIPGNKYSFHNTIVLPNGIQSKEAVTYAQTKTNIQSLLQDLGLEQHYPNKLTLKDVLQIDMRSVSDEPAQSPSSLPWLFLKKLMMQLLREDAFEQYVKYISSYEHFVKGWISDQITKQFSNGHEMSELEERYLRGITTEILEAVKMAQNETYEDGIKGFIQCICRKLGQKLVIPKDALEIVMVLNNASQDSFACWLTKSVEEIEQTLQEQLKKINIKQKLSKLKMKPQDELFKRVFGCGKQCPFCKTPCEAGGEAHSEHCASVHRPQGLGFYINESDKKLVTDICSTDVHSEQKFKCFETNYEYHPYKKYREIFPDWHIPADVSIQASDYWKYVMARFNTKFAEEYNARPADIPFAWKLIKKEQAEKSLKESFSIK